MDELAFRGRRIVLPIVAVTGGTVSTLGKIALGGFTLFLGFHLHRRPLPVPLVLGQAATAVVAFLALLAQIFTA